MVQRAGGVRRKSTVRSKTEKGQAERGKPRQKWRDCNVNAAGTGDIYETG
jgi:hypothetical protein